MKNKIIDFTSSLDEIKEDQQQLMQKSIELKDETEETENACKQLAERISSLTGMQISDSHCEQDNLLKSLNKELHNIDAQNNEDEIYTLEPIDIIVSVFTGVIESVIDIIFVGTPEVVKLYRGRYDFDGSLLTGILRDIGNGDDRLSNFLKFLSDKCKVPYDISAIKDTVNPRNHRLRNFAHDPLFGLFFAVTDIIMGTCTVIDNDGRIKVIVNSNEYPESQKWLAALYYMGHLLSDVCTYMGLPIPGFAVTQFFTTGESKSIARMCEEMYKDGYDLRHLASMSTPVAAKSIILRLYTEVFKKDKFNLVQNIAEKEIYLMRKKVFVNKMNLISDAVACSGNIAKYMLPITSGNMTALNLPEWIELTRDALSNAKFELRNKDIENIQMQRKIIDANWEELLR